MTAALPGAYADKTVGSLSGGTEPIAAAFSDQAGCFEGLGRPVAEGDAMLWRRFVGIVRRRMDRRRRRRH